LINTFLRGIHQARTRTASAFSSLPLQRRGTELRRSCPKIEKCGIVYSVYAFSVNFDPSLSLFLQENLIGARLLVAQGGMSCQLAQAYFQPRQLHVTYSLVHSPKKMRHVKVGDLVKVSNSGGSETGGSDTIGHRSRSGQHILLVTPVEPTWIRSEGARR
jgi:hypothetical protein